MAALAHATVDNARGGNAVAAARVEDDAHAGVPAGVVVGPPPTAAGGATVEAQKTNGVLEVAEAKAAAAEMERRKLGDGRGGEGDHEAAMIEVVGGEGGVFKLSRAQAALCCAFESAETGNEEWGIDRVREGHQMAGG